MKCVPAGGRLTTSAGGHFSVLRICRSIFNAKMLYTHLSRRGFRGGTAR